jgi:hypothetical protein
MDIYLDVFQNPLNCIVYLLYHCDVENSVSLKVYLISLGAIFNKYFNAV